MIYPKIETLYERDEQTHKFKPGIFKNRTYTLLKEWQFTEKIDGTNIRCIWQDGKLTFGGKKDNAQIHADLIRWLYENVSAIKMAKVFPDCPAVLYGEGYGAGIQKGGGNYSPIKKFILYDVLVDGRWWLSWENTCDVAAKLNLDVVPYLGSMTLEQATEMVRVGFPSKLGSATPAEGVVGRPAETLFDKKGHRLITKLKTKDFDGNF
ncbi:MAG TPA: RNA ligase family protein [Syntrophales bacterium]|nr:RNA ligase family protein [Syntrophales bacterium]